MHASIRLVSSTHSGREKWLRRSEISSSGEVEGWVATTRFGGVVLASAGLELAADFLGFPAARSGASVDLGLGFWSLAVSLVAVTLGFSGAFVTF